MSKFKVPRPLVGAMEAAAVCSRRCSNVLPPNMALVSLFNHDTISVNLLLRLDILLALCYFACEVPATSHEDLLTSLGTSLRGRRSAEASRPPTPSLAAHTPSQKTNRIP